MEPDPEILHELHHNIGMRIFVCHYRQFADSTLSNDQVVEMLPNDLVTRDIRVSAAPRLIRDGRAIETLEIISASRGADAATVRGAVALLAALRDENNL